MPRILIVTLSSQTYVSYAYETSGSAKCLEILVELPNWRIIKKGSAPWRQCSLEECIRNLDWIHLAQDRTKCELFYQTNKLHGLSPPANYTDRATAALLPKVKELREA
jgi:hypothetical protein